MVGFLFVCFGPLYWAILHRIWHGQTIGKRATRTRVVNIDGTPLRTGQCLARAYLMAWWPGCLVALFHSERRALHDLATGTVVVPVTGSTRPGVH